MSQNYDLFRQAIMEKKAVVFDYQGFERVACPHVLGLKEGLEKVLTFQFAGGSKSGLPPDGQWRCLFISEAFNLRLIETEWHTGHSHTRPQTCVDDIHVEVLVDDYGVPTPYLRRAYS